MPQKTNGSPMLPISPTVQSEQGGLKAHIMPIAVIGMAFRGPGDATSPQKLWDMCCEGRNAWTEFPKDKIRAEGFWHPEPSRPGCLNSKGGHFLKEDAGMFDAPFFGISPNEAKAMDPQHRLLLELSYEALENAGIPLQQATGTKTAVFVGFCGSDYTALLFKDPEIAPKYTTTGTAYSVLANHISYVFNLKGPSCAVDTACSASLTAIHLACQSLRLGEAVQAIVGGVGILLSPDLWSSMSSLGLFSEEGRCYSFDERAAGYGRGEGAGTVVLKPLDDAIRDNDSIHSVIRHVGVNHDGRTRGLVLPNQKAQTELIQRVYLEAGLDPGETHYVEAHGPGTAVGDPIEAGAIAEAIASRKSSELVVGSVKSNVGHMEGASGLAGFIKTSLILREGKVPPTANFQSPNKRIPLQDWNIQVATSLEDWPVECIRRASVSSFGFGGSNCHVILEGPPEDRNIPDLDISNTFSTTEKNLNVSDDGLQKVVVLSAANQNSAKAQAMNLISHLKTRKADEKNNAFFERLVHTLTSRRSHLEWRLTLLAGSVEDLLESLDVSRLEARKISTKKAKLGFIFSGQGSQWQGMARELMRDFPIFAAVIDESEIHLRKLGATWSLKDVLCESSSLDIHDPQISQPATTSLQIGIAALLRSWNIVPTKVTGHSSGEIAAAYAIGALSLRSSLFVAYHRGRLASSLKTGENGACGAMLAIGASHAKVNTMLKIVNEGKMTVACINAPSLVIASGDVLAIEALEVIAQSESLFVQRVRVDVAYHSHHMHLIADEYLDCLGEIETSPGERDTFYSSLHGRAFDAKSLTSMYWVEHLVSPVKFCDAVEEMCFDFQTEDAEASAILIEIGPHSNLKAAIHDIVKSNGWNHKVTYLPSLLAAQDGTAQMLRLASKLFVQGQSVDLETVNFPNSKSKLKPVMDLPAYAWKHDVSYWHESRLSQNHRLRAFPRNDLLGSLTNDYSDLEPRWRNIIRAKDLPWLLQHKVQGVAVFPFAGFISMALEALKQWSLLRSTAMDSYSTYELREVLVSRPLVISEVPDIETSVNLKALTDGTRSLTSAWNEFTISTWMQDQGWTEHCKGLIRLSGKSLSHGHLTEDHVLHKDEAIRKVNREMEQACKTLVNCNEFYQTAAKAGLEYGPAFRNLCEARATPSMCIGWVNEPDIAVFMPKGHQTKLVIHPAFLDALFHPLLISIGGQDLEAKDTYVPVFVKSFSISNSARAAQNHVCFAKSHLGSSGHPFQNSLKVFSDTHTYQAPFIEMEEMKGAVLPQTDSSHHLKRELCYKLIWKPLDEQIKPSGETKTLRDETSIGGAKCINRKAVAVAYNRHPGNEMIQSIKKRFNGVGGTCPSSALEDIVPEHRIYVFLDLAEPVMQDFNGQRLLLLQKLFARAAAVLWVTCTSRTGAENPTSSMSAGWMRCLRCEMANIKLVTLTLDVHSLTDFERVAGMIYSVLHDVIWEETSSSLDMEYADVNGKLAVPRLVPDDQKNEYITQQIHGQVSVLQPYKQLDRNLQLSMKTLGSLESMCFTDSDIAQRPLGDDEIQIEIRATGMNFKDVMVSLGQIRYTEPGLECSGYVAETGTNARNAGFKKGDRVCAIGNACYANVTRAAHHGVMKIPDDMDFATAASIPIVYCTAFHALFDVGRLTHGEAVLIHSAAGGVGQAAVMLARHIGAEVFATVGSEDKKRLLVEEYGILQDHIFSSRATTFEKGILEATQGKGIALVLGSVSSETRRLSLNVLSPLGRFVEIGKRDLELNAHLELTEFKKALTFAAVDLEILGRHHPGIIKRLLKLVFDALRDHHQIIKPVTPITKFLPSRLESAMRMMQGGKHAGKIVIEADDADHVMANPPLEPLTFRSDVTYLIIGGTGGIGRSLTRWMAAEGAKFIMLVSRSGQFTVEIQALVQDMASMGTCIEIQKCDVGRESDVEHLVACPSSRGLPPIAGVIHGPLVLQDVLFAKSAIEDHLKVVEPRVQGAWNLHNALLATRTELDFFILLSSASGVLGNPGQSAYAASNSFLDAFAQFRRDIGLPASSIALGLVDGVGYASRNIPGYINIDAIVHDTIKEGELHALVKAAIADKNPDCDYTQTITGIKLEPTKPLPFWAKDPKMLEILPRFDANAHGGDLDQAASVPNALKFCTSVDEAARIVCEALVSKFSAISLTPIEELDVQKNFDSYGMDSLVAVEIRNWIARELRAELSLLEFMKVTNLSQLSRVVVEKSRFSIHLTST